MVKELDPDAPLVGEDGLEYENAAEYLCGRPVQCRRNQEIALLRLEVHQWVQDATRGAPEGAPSFKGAEDAHWARLVRAVYQHLNRDGYHLAFGQNNEAHRPQFWEGPGKARTEALEAERQAAVRNIPGLLTADR